MLAVLDLDFKKMRIEVDALDYITGGVLSIECEDGKWRPVVFFSKSLNADSTIKVWEVAVSG